MYLPMLTCILLDVVPIISVSITALGEIERNTTSYISIQIYKQMQLIDNNSISR